VFIFATKQTCLHRHASYGTGIKVFATAHNGWRWLAAIATVAAMATSSSAQEATVEEPSATITLSTPQPAPTPDAPSAFKFSNRQDVNAEQRRITAEEKFHIFLASSISSEMLSEAAINTRLMDDWKSGRFSTAPGYWTRYRTELATSESRALLSKYVLPVVFHQDPRYHRMEEGGIFRRGFYAASRVLITRSDDGSSTFNTSHVLGALGSRTMANVYLPNHDRTWGHTLQSTGSVLLSDVGRNLMREFGPDLKARFFGTRLGAKFSRIAQRVRTIGVEREQLQ
jgi:hypothetical protein